MKTLNEKIKKTLSSEDKGGHTYLNAEELTTLVRMRRVKHINFTGGVDRFTEVDGLEYYPPVSSLSLTKKQAKQLAKDFTEWGTKDDKPLFAKVYLSDWSHHSDNGLYVAL